MTPKPQIEWIAEIQQQIAARPEEIGLRESLARRLNELNERYPDPSLAARDRKSVV